MQSNQRIVAVCLLMVGLLIASVFVSGCGSGQVFGPTLTPAFTPSPTFTPAPTFTSTPASTPTPTITPTPESSTIMGKVYWRDKNLPIKAQININSSDPKTSLQATTDADGKYKFTDLKPGVYGMGIVATLESERISSCSGVNSAFSREPDTNFGMVLTMGTKDNTSGNMEFKTSANGDYTISGGEVQIDIVFWCP
jgi:hypothetical protein